MTLSTEELGIKMQEIYRFNCWKTAPNRPNTQNLKPKLVNTKESKNIMGSREN